jgi:transcriptional regulator with XRE-family HTH domain
MPFRRQIGQRMLAKRIALGMTQKQIASQLSRPVTAQQIGRYEKGVDYISASRLNEIAIMMEVSPGSFYPPRHDGAGAGTNANRVATTDKLTKLLKDPYAIRVLQALATVRGKNRRAYVIEFVETFASRFTTSWPSRDKQVGVE